MDDRFKKLRLQRGTIRYLQRAYTLQDVSAQVTELSETSRRHRYRGVSAKLRRRAGPAEVLRVGGPGFEWILAVSAKEAAAARLFADAVNEAAEDYARDRALPDLTATDLAPGRLAASNDEPAESPAEPTIFERAFQAHTEPNRRSTRTGRQAS